MANEQEEGDKEARIRVANIVTIGDMVSRSVQAICKYSMYCVGFYFTYKSIDSLAVNLNGQVTIADIKFQAVIDWMSDKDTTCVLGVIIGVAGTVFGLVQKKLRKDVIERLHPYQEKYEKLVDEGRTSSALTARGDTRPEDK